MPEIDNPEKAFRRLTHRHRVTGKFYTYQGEAKIENASFFKGETLALLRAEDGTLEAMLKAEFEDGRFEELK